jgi:hypothetical protein
MISLEAATLLYNSTNIMIVTSLSLNVTSIWKRKLHTATKQLNDWMFHLDCEQNSEAQTAANTSTNELENKL